MSLLKFSPRSLAFDLTQQVIGQLITSTGCGRPAGDKSPIKRQFSLQSSAGAICPGAMPAPQQALDLIVEEKWPGVTRPSRHRG